MLRHFPRAQVIVAVGYLLFPLGFVEGVEAQVNSMRVAVPSPTAASLGKFGDIPVSLASGLPDITVPLFTVQGHTLELPITLRYAAGGIRVEEIGGWVGMGWNLDAGGVITRTVRGKADDDVGGYWSTGHTWYASGNWPNPDPTLLDQVAQGTIDAEPDQFFFNFSGRSGQFVAGPTDSTGTVQEIRPIPYQRLRIEEVGFGGADSEWVITTEDGTRFTFGARETNTDFSVTTPGDQVPTNYGSSHISSWHLTRIESPGGDVVTLHYTPYTVRHRTPDSYIEKFDHVIAGPDEPCVPSQFSVMQEYEVTAMRLDSVRSARHTARFITDAAPRADALDPVTGEGQEPRLDRIIIETPGGVELRRFQLEHDYFGGNRLRLTRVYEEDPTGDRLPPWTFTYDPQSFPSRTSKAQDHWGYWNGKSNSTLIPQTTTPSGGVLSGADRSPDAERMRVGSLTRITYPTGGFTEFTWESLDYGFVSNDTAHVRSPSDPKSQSISSSDFQQFNSASFTIGGIDSVIVSASVTILPSDCGTQIGCPFAQIEGEQDWYGSAEDALLLAPGTYTLRTYSDMTDGFASIHVTWQDMELAKKKKAGGIRVARIVTDDGFGNEEERTFQYTLQADPERSSGVIKAEPRYHYSYESPQCAYFSRSSRSRMPLGDGPTVLYQEVTVSHGPEGELGSSRETFRTFNHAPDPMALVPPPEWWPFSRVTTFAWKRGQRIEGTAFSTVGDPQEREVTTYSFQDTEALTSRRFRGISFNSFSAGQRGSAYVFTDFEVISAWYHPASDTLVVYDEGGSSSFSTVRTYEYGNPAHLQVTEVRESNSDGTERVTRMRYPADYDAESGTPDAETAALAAMQGEAHIHSAIIERWVSEVSGTIEQVVEGELTTFRLFSGRPLPYRRFVLDRTEIDP